MPPAKGGGMEIKMEIKIGSDDILEMFYDSFKIPAGIFDREGKLQKLFFAGGTRLTKLYLADASFVLEKYTGNAKSTKYNPEDAGLAQENHTGAARLTRPNSEDPGSASKKDSDIALEDPAELLLDKNGSCWCVMPYAEETILLGPVQTGRNPLFAYEGIPEHTGNGFFNIARYIVSLLCGADKVLLNKEDAYTEEFAARHMYRKGYVDVEVELQSFDEIFLCVMTGDRARLDDLLHSGSYLRYLDNVMPDLQTARTVFQFNLAKTYHSAQQSQLPISDLTPLVNMYLTESAGYKSLAAYKSGMLRMLYDFTRYVSQYRDDRYSPLVNRAIMYIREHIYTQLAVEEVAAHCMSSLSTLQHRFKAETGMSVKEKIRRSKLERACFFLKNTDLSGTDIAFRLGYGSQSYFIKQFRALTNMTPAEYRR